MSTLQAATATHPVLRPAPSGLTGAVTAPASAATAAVCGHPIPCPDADAPDRHRARVLVAHPQQGWSLLCNGVIEFEDLGALAPERGTGG
jgi:Family of unknown function (DUF5999)